MFVPGFQSVSATGITVENMCPDAAEQATKSDQRLRSPVSKSGRGFRFMVCTCSYLRLDNIAPKFILE